MITPETLASQTNGEIEINQEILVGTIGELPELYQFYHLATNHFCPVGFWQASVADLKRASWPLFGPLANDGKRLNKFGNLSLPPLGSIFQYLPDELKTVGGFICMPKEKLTRLSPNTRKNIIDNAKQLVWYISINLGYGLFIADIFDSQPCSVTPETARAMKMDVESLFASVASLSPEHHSINHKAWTCFFRNYFGIGSFDINTHLKIKPSYRRLIELGLTDDNKTSLTSDMVEVPFGYFIRQVARYRGKPLFNYQAYRPGSLGYQLFGCQCIADTRLGYPEVDPNQRLVDLIGPLVADIRLCGTCPGVPVYDVYDLLSHFDPNLYQGDTSKLILTIKKAFDLK